LPQPLSVQFGCEGVTITGIELEVAGQPISKLIRRFDSGEYKVSV